MNKTKKVLLGTMLAGAVTVGAGFGTGTFSDFVDSASSTGNKIETGKLDISLTGQTFSATNKAPGYKESQTFTISNDGTLDAKDLKAVATVTVKKDGAAVTDLSPYGDFQVSFAGHTVPLKDVKSTIENNVGGTLARGAHQDIPVQMELVRKPGVNQNEYQNLSVEVSVEVSAAAYEN
ncbi:TasA family protein [Fictibacillus sp. B-59209]|uniref:TasA family protein n=1 Tax=Fictibacillus sp. B-59209 TaxID=3024873 RepID=UPI002E20A9CF|nr:TasA family protein [Fictibacillus sp. B-59209]